MKKILALVTAITSIMMMATGTVYAEAVTTGVADTPNGTLFIVGGLVAGSVVTVNTLKGRNREEEIDADTTKE